jgi:hypothetical protein
MTTEQAIEAAELAAFFMHDDREDREPYGPGETARVTAAANEALAAERPE